MDALIFELQNLAAALDAMPTDHDARLAAAARRLQRALQQAVRIHQATLTTTTEEIHA